MQRQENCCQFEASLLHISFSPTWQGVVKNPFKGVRLYLGLQFQRIQSSKARKAWEQEPLGLGPRGEAACSGQKLGSRELGLEVELALSQPSLPATIHFPPGPTSPYRFHGLTKQHRQPVPKCSNGIP